MKKEDLKIGKLVKNIKHGNTETIIGTCLMKMESGNWVDGVIYEGMDRFSNERKTFVKKLEDFLNEFEILENNIFKTCVD